MAEKMVLAIAGSPREEGNTVRLGREVLKPARKAGLETELISLAGKEIQGCRACMWCRERGISDPDQARCRYEDDFNEIYELIKRADALLLGSPVYFGSATPELKALMDRAGFAGRTDQFNVLRRKVGAPFTVARRAGQNYTFAQIMYFFMICDMVVPGSSYWNVSFGRGKGEVEADEEGLATLRHLGENVVWLLEKLED